MVRLIHRFWAGRDMPDDYHRFGTAWAVMNPDWQVHDWTLPEVMELPLVNRAVVEDLFRRDAARNTVELAVQLADVIDYELVWLFGGVYLNCDIEPVAPLHTMHSLYGTQDCAWVASEDQTFVVNAAMGAPDSEHPFFGRVITALAPRYWSNPAAPMNVSTGPWLLTDVWRESTDVTALPAHVFNPHHWSTIPLGGDAAGRTHPPGTIGIHHWGHRRDRRTNSIEHGNPATVG